MNELKFTTAAFFRNKGKNVVTESEFVNGVSLDQRWVTPSEAVRLASLLISRGYLKKDGEYLRPAFDVHTVDVPLNFRPSAGVLNVPAPKAPAPKADDLISELMEKASSAGIAKKDLIASVNALQKRLNVDFEVAALVILREKGVDITEYIDATYERTAKR
jgi:hypothetical protein